MNTVTLSSQADCDRIFGPGEVNFAVLVEHANRGGFKRFDEEKPPAGHHAPAPEESEGV